MRFVVNSIVVAMFCASGAAFADCVADLGVDEARAAYVGAQSAEASGDRRAAVLGYRRAQGYTCDPNPVAAEAARRAAPLALELGRRAEQVGRLAGGNDSAFTWFEAGGYYAQADRVLW